jgi:hypothetical protein
VLRALYRGDAWRMQALMKSIGKDVPRNQPMKNWEQDAKEFLEYVTSKGLPKAQAKP